MVSRSARRQIAATIHHLPVDFDRYVVTERFADMLASNSRRFNREKFIAAAVWGIEERPRSLIRVPRRRVVPAETRTHEGVAGRLEGRY